jgi:hypothetical protein
MPRAYSDTGAIGSGSQFPPDRTLIDNFALRHRALSLHCRQLRAQRGMSQPPLTVLQVLSFAGCCLPEHHEGSTIIRETVHELTAAKDDLFGAGKRLPERGCASS